MALKRGFCWVASLAGALALSIAASAGATTTIAEHPSGESPAEVRSHWTAERMRAAVPMDLPGSPVAGAQAPAAAAAIPPDQETNPALDTVYPQRLHGKLFMNTIRGPGTCSATVVTARSRNLIVTAAHCLVIPGEQSGGAGIAWATDVLFVPAYRNGAAPFGGFPATRIGAPTAFAQSGDVSFDFGAATLAPGPSGQIQDALGARGIAFNRSAKSYRNDSFEIYGYPAKPNPDYDAERLILCLSQFQGFEAFTGAPVIAPCNQQEGASGGGWIRNGQVQSLVSHAACAVPQGCNAISGSYFGEVEFKLYRRFSGGISKGKSKRLKRCKRIDRRAKRLRCRGRVQRFAADPR